jgi:hypothetical protein
MSIAPLVQLYTTSPGGVAIMVDAQNPPLTAATQRVTLTTDVSQLCPPGWPAAPDETGAAAASLWYPRTIANGTTITAYACVAAALIVAGAATAA